MLVDGGHNLVKVNCMLLVKERDDIMRHVFRVTKLGWGEEQEGIWFDSDDYTEEEAKAEFVPYQDTTQDGYPYTGFDYQGEKFHDVTYLGEYEEDEMPRNDYEYFESLNKKNKKR